ncbi:MAG: dienelactone hydrolase family protein [Gemmatimonadota bacterium]|nr:dienelactone hydrolase family protein [Gemmatimonadota bacterium]
MNQLPLMMPEGTRIRIPAGSVELDGDLVIPVGAEGLVVFAHGSGSSRRSPRNRFVATTLQRAGLATVLFDLLTADEDRVDMHTAEYRFDVPMLAERLVEVTDWLKRYPPVDHLALGLFGASTGAAAALIAAGRRRREVAAVVSRGGRPDLAGDALSHVYTPTLLIVGERDPIVLDLNRKALEELKGPRELKVVPGATHLFEEEGALGTVARLAAEWFTEHLAGVSVA